MRTGPPIFQYGLDVLLARSTPSAGFDVLNDDFNYALLIGTVVSLFGGVVWLKRELTAHQLEQAWK